MTAVDQRPDNAGPAADEVTAAKVAVIAHRRKSLGGGLPEFRRALEAAGITDPAWFEVPKSKKAPKQVRQALKQGAELILVWGGDGMVQRCIDALVGSDVTVGIIPAGTANLLAKNLGIPHDLDGALEIALAGRSRRLDVGVVNGEHFAVMAGAGFDARMIEDADRGQQGAPRQPGLRPQRGGRPPGRRRPGPRARRRHDLLRGPGQLRAGRQRPPGDRRAPRLQRRRTRRRSARRRRRDGRGGRAVAAGAGAGWRSTAATAPPSSQTIQGRTHRRPLRPGRRLRARRRDPARRPTGCGSR